MKKKNLTKLTTAGMQDLILNSNCLCSPSLSNICIWLLLFSEHSLHNSDKLKSSFNAIIILILFTINTVNNKNTDLITSVQYKNVFFQRFLISQILKKNSK